MEPLKHTFQKDEHLFTQDDRPGFTFLIDYGKVRITRHLGEVEVPISLLGQGDVVLADAAAEPQLQVQFTATAAVTTSGYLLPADEFTEHLKQLPPWARRFVSNSFKTQSIHERPERSNVATLYGILDVLYAFLKLADTSSTGQQLRGPLKPILEEIRNSRSISRHLVQPVLDSLSQVALIDVRHGDPLTPVIIMPDIQLFLAFLAFLQNTADLKEGLHESVFVLNPLQLSREAHILVDGLMMDDELATRLFEPERSMVHLPIERLQQIYTGAGGNGQPLDAYHPCLKELESLGAFSRVVDNQQVSVFLNLRNLLRLTIRREPTSNFVDIIDFLLEQMFAARFEIASATHYRELT